jgi:hypothetical protein
MRHVSYLTAIALLTLYICNVLIEEVVLKHRLGQKIEVVTGLENWQIQRQRKLIPVGV